MCNVIQYVILCVCYYSIKWLMSNDISILINIVVLLVILLMCVSV